MRRLLLLVFLLASAYALNACGWQAETSGPEAEVQGVMDLTGLLDGLRSAGATAEVVDTITQAFFSPEGVFITINGEEDIQVFEYENTEAMESEAAQVTPDGSSVGTSTMMWVDAPHFFKSGRILVLYIGSNSAILDLLDTVLGPQFAGR